MIFLGSVGVNTGFQFKRPVFKARPPYLLPNLEALNGIIFWGSDYFPVTTLSLCPIPHLIDPELISTPPFIHVRPY